MLILKITVLNNDLLSKLTSSTTLHILMELPMKSSTVNSEKDQPKQPQKMPKDDKGSQKPNKSK